MKCRNLKKNNYLLSHELGKNLYCCWINELKSSPCRTKRCVSKKNLEWERNRQLKRWFLFWNDLWSSYSFFNCPFGFFFFSSWQSFHFRPFQLFIFCTVQSKAKNWEANFHTNYLNGHKIFTNEPLNQLTKYYSAKATVYGSVRYNTGFRWVKLTVQRDFCHKSRQSIVLWNNITEVLLH